MIKLLLLLAFYILLYLFQIRNIDSKLLPNLGYVFDCKAILHLLGYLQQREAKVGIPREQAAVVSMHQVRSALATPAPKMVSQSTS